MTAHPVPRKISFTGSVATGKKVARPRRRRTSSGSPSSSAATTPRSSSTTPTRPRSPRSSSGRRFANNGQVCSAIKRVYVPEALHDDVVEALAAQAAARQGRRRRSRRARELGPINNQPAVRPRAASSSTTRSTDGATRRGRRRRRARRRLLLPADDPRRRHRRHAHRRRGAVRPRPPGHLATATSTTRSQRANATNFGLSGSVWGARRRSGRASVAGRLECGTAWVNTAPAIPPAPAVRRREVERHRRRERALGPLGFTELQVVYRRKQ